MTNMTDRKQQESIFHDQRELDRHELSDEEYQRKYSNKKWYSVTRRSRKYVSEMLERDCKGKTALDYCCGLGDMSLELAKHGAFVYGIDISEQSIKTSKQLLTGAGYGDRSKHLVMDAEKLEFEDDFFDVIVCAGVLHHLDLSSAYREISRVLKPSGRVICIEALGHNPIIQTYRRMTPHLRTAWEVDHILKQKDLVLARQFFNQVDARFFHLFTILAVPFRETTFFHPLLAGLEGLDSVVLRLPLLRYMAWQMVFVLRDPK